MFAFLFTSHPDAQNVCLWLPKRPGCSKWPLEPLEPAFEVTVCSKMRSESLLEILGLGNTGFCWASICSPPPLNVIYTLKYSIVFSLEASHFSTIVIKPAFNANDCISYDLCVWEKFDLFTRMVCKIEAIFRLFNINFSFNKMLRFSK